MKRNLVYTLEDWNYLITLTNMKEETEHYISLLELRAEFLGSQFLQVLSDKFKRLEEGHV